jgi:hypothetical protein
MFRAGFVSAVFITSALSCQKVDDEPRTGDERPVSPVPAQVLSPVTDWETVGGVAVRVHKTIVQQPTVEERTANAGTKWRERELGQSALMVWVQIENRTQSHPLVYNGFGYMGPPRENPSVTDEFGTVYAMQNHESATRRLRDRAPRTVIKPGDKVVTDVLCFERPGAAATTLTLTLPALIGSEGAGYRFALPAVAWKK